MKKLGLLMMLLLLSRIALFCQAQTAGIEEKEEIGRASCRERV